MHCHEWVRVGQIKSTWMRRLQPPTMTHTAFHWKIEFALFRAASSTHRPKNRFQFHTVSRWPRIMFGSFSPSNDAHTVHIQRKRPIRVSQMKRQICAWPKIPSRVKTHRYERQNKINSNIYEITFLFMTLFLVCELCESWVSGSSNCRTIYS